TFGSLTPSASIRRCRTCVALSVVSLVAFTVGESLASSTICVPPRRSRPSCGFAVNVTYVDAARTRNARSARTRDDRFTEASGGGHPLGRGCHDTQVERTVYGPTQATVSQP